MAEILGFEDLMCLRQPFETNEHEFRGGYAYITESAITTRIEDVDPAWTFVLLSTVIRDNQAVVTARMTIKGVSRDGIGMQVILDKGQGEPEKGAATDAMKRCARLFGVGRYLLDLPSGVSDIPSLTKWLAGTGKVPEQRQPAQETPPVKVGVPAVTLNKAYAMVNKLMSRPTFDVIVGSFDDLKPSATPMFIAQRAIDTHKARENSKKQAG